MSQHCRVISVKNRTYNRLRPIGTNYVARLYYLTVFEYYICHVRVQLVGDEVHDLRWTAYGDVMFLDSFTKHALGDMLGNIESEGEFGVAFEDVEICPSLKAIAIPDLASGHLHTRVDYTLRRDDFI